MEGGGVGEANYGSVGEESDPLLFWHARRASGARGQDTAALPARRSALTSKGFDSRHGRRRVGQLHVLMAPAVRCFAQRESDPRAIAPCAGSSSWSISTALTQATHSACVHPRSTASAR